MPVHRPKIKHSFAFRWIESSIAKRLSKVAKFLDAAAFGTKNHVRNVHRLRVATRQAMATIQFLKEFLPRKQVSKTLKRLRDIRKIAGDARDIDVFLNKHQGTKDWKKRHLKNLVCEIKLSALDPIVQLAIDVNETDAIRQQTNRLIGSVKLKLVPFRRKDFLNWTRKRLAMSFVPLLDFDENQFTSLQHLHEFRVQCKQLRYSLELVAEFIDPRTSEKALRTLANIQDRLGQINDRAVGCKRLKKWASNCKKSERKILLKLREREKAKLQSELKQTSEAKTRRLVQKLRKRLQDCLKSFSKLDR